MDIVAPMGDILNDHLVRRVHRETGRHMGGPGIDDTPAVGHIHLADLGSGIVIAKRVLDNLQELILVHKAVGISTVDRLLQVLTNGQHTISSFDEFYCSPMESGFWGKYQPVMPIKNARPWENRSKTLRWAANPRPGSAPGRKFSSPSVNRYSNNKTIRTPACCKHRSPRW